MIDFKSKSVRGEVIIIAVLLLMIGLFYSWLISHATKESYTEDIGMTSEARRNPFLAARYFIERRGGEIHLMRDFSLFDQPLNPADTLIISNSRKPLSERRLEILDQFVANGGHLILRAIEEFDDEKSKSGAPILDDLGVRFYRSETDQALNLLNDDNEEPTNSHLGYHANFIFEDEKSETKVKFDPYSYLIDASGESIFQGGTDSNDHFIRYQVGEGFVTVLSDLNFWTNKDIDHADHAMFLHQLTQGKSKIWIVYNPQVDTLPSLIWQYASFLVISAFVFLVFIIWHSQFKTAPIFPQFSTTRRQLMQHIQASANFRWRNTSLETMLSKTRNNLFIQTKFRHRRFDKLPRNEQVDLIHNWTNINKKQVSNALFEAPKDQWVFQEQMKVLQTAINHLYGTHR